MKNIKTADPFIALVMFGSLVQPAFSATGEMGTGIPEFGIHSAPMGTFAWVGALTNPTIPFPSGCTSLKLTSATMGLDGYKMAVATMLTAKLAGKRVRFFAHSPRDEGCGVDYVQIVN